MKTMRPKRVVLPLAFLSAVFVLACQDATTNPLTLDSTPAQFAKGGRGGTGDNPGSAIYLYTAAGVIGTSLSPAGAQGTVGNNDGLTVVLQHCCQNTGPVEALIVDGTFLDGFELNGDNCFAGDITDDQFIGGLTRDKKVVDKVEAIFYFTAKAKNGVDLVPYKLILNGTTDSEDGIFPPEPTEVTTVTFTHASIGAQRKKEKNACSGAVPLSGGTSVELTGIS